MEPITLYLNKFHSRVYKSHVRCDFDDCRAKAFFIINFDAYTPVATARHITNSSKFQMETLVHALYVKRLLRRADSNILKHHQLIKTPIG
jgi:hypothetical protein